MRKARKIDSLLLGIAALWLLAAGIPVAAGEAPPPVQPPKVEKTEDKKPSDEKAWVFESRNRRDPFTFALKPTIVDDTGTSGTGDLSKTPQLDPKLIKLKQEQAEEMYRDAENLFMEIGRDGRAVETVTKCDAGLKIFTDIPNYGAIPEWQPVRAKLEALRKASERMKQRQDAEKKFKEINIRLTGVVARDRHSQAIVNGKSVGKGDIVAASDNYDVAVDDIHPDQVVFVTPDGFKVKLTWTEMSK